MKFYEIYLSLRYIILNAYEIVNLLKEYRVDKINLLLKLKNQRLELERFIDLLVEIGNYLAIFDKETYKEIINIVGIKRGILDSIEDSIDVINPKENDILVANWLNKTFDIRALRLMRIDLSFLHREGYIALKKYDLSKKDDIDELCDNALKHILLMEKTLDKFADFIKSNCELKDLFPGNVASGRKRRYQLL